MSTPSISYFNLGLSLAATSDEPSRNVTFKVAAESSMKAALIAKEYFAPREIAVVYCNPGP